MEMILVHLSAIESVGYDPLTKGMKVKFKSKPKIYDYYNISESVYKNFMNSISGIITVLTPKS